MINNMDIYKRASKLFDDPDIERALSSNIIAFAKILNQFLENGVAYFTAPLSIVEVLSQKQPPEGQIEILQGTGVETYNLSIAPKDGSEIVGYINKKVDIFATYNKNDNSITFSRPVTTEEECAIEWYHAGAFIGDFNKVSKYGNRIENEVINILARSILVAWAEGKVNWLLEIRNILMDTDFKIHSPAANLTAKVGWLKDLRYSIYSMQNKLDWDLRNQAYSDYGY